MDENKQNQVCRRKVSNLTAYYGHDQSSLLSVGDKDLQSHLLDITDNKGAPDM